MVTSIPLSEPRVKAIKPPLPAGASMRDVYKDLKFNGLQLFVYPSGNRVYYYVRRMGGRPRRIKLGSALVLSVEQARNAAKVYAGEIAAGRNPQCERREAREEPTLQKLWEHWLLHANAHKRPRSVQEDKRIWNRHLKPWAKKRLGSIKKSDVQSLHSALGTTSGVYSANRMLALLRAMLNKAADIGYAGDNPARGVKMFKETERDRFLHIDELEAFFKAVAGEPGLFRDFFLLLLLTGARKSNMLAMRWADLDLSAGYWRIPETKGGNVMIVPLVAPALSILAARRDMATGEWVFPGHRRGTHLKDPQKPWVRVLQKAGLTDLRLHDLRRSLGSHMACANVSSTIIGKVLGHRPGSAATAVYARLAMDPQRAAMDAAVSAMWAAGKQTQFLTVDVTPANGE